MRVCLWLFVCVSAIPEHELHELFRSRLERARQDPRGSGRGGRAAAAGHHGSGSGGIGVVRLD